MDFTEEYPNKPPTVKFMSRIFHPNGKSIAIHSHQVRSWLQRCIVYADGSICLDILQNNWSSIYDVGAVLTSLQSLLSDPNPNSPANVEAARLFQENKAEYYKRVADVVEKSWEFVE